MLRTTEIKSIMHKLRENSQATEVKAEVKNESLITNEADEVDSENDVSQSDLLLARLEDIISRFEKALAIVDDEDADTESDEEAPTEDESAEEDVVPEEEEPSEEDESEDEEAAEESYERSLEDRLAALERRFTESRRRKACRRLRY